MEGEDDEEWLVETIQSSTTEIGSGSGTGTGTGKEHEGEGGRRKEDVDADDYSARDEKEQQQLQDNEDREGGEDGEEEDDLSSYRGITSTISNIRPVQTDTAIASRQSTRSSRGASRQETKDEKKEREQEREEEEHKKRQDAIVNHYMRKTEENINAVGYEKLLCDEVMLTTTMKQLVEYNVGKMYTRFKLASWHKKEVYVKQYKTSGKPIFNGEHYFLKIASKDEDGNEDYVHMKVFKPGVWLFFCLVSFFSIHIYMPVLLIYSISSFSFCLMPVVCFLLYNVQWKARALIPSCWITPSKTKRMIQLNFENLNWILIIFYIIIFFHLLVLEQLVADA